MRELDPEQQAEREAKNVLAERGIVIDPLDHRPPTRILAFLESLSRAEETPLPTETKV